MQGNKKPLSSVRRGAAALLVITAILMIVAGAVLEVAWKRERGRLGAVARQVADRQAPDAPVRIAAWVRASVADLPTPSAPWAGPEHILVAGGDAAGKARLTAVLISTLGIPARVGMAQSCRECPDQPVALVHESVGWVPVEGGTAITASRPLILDTPKNLLSQAGSLGGALLFCMGLLMLPTIRPAPGNRDS